MATARIRLRTLREATLTIADELEARSMSPPRIDPSLVHWVVCAPDVYMPESTPCRLQRRSIAEDLARIEAGPCGAVGTDVELLLAYSSVLRVVGRGWFSPSADPTWPPIAPLFRKLVPVLDALDPDGETSAQLTSDFYWFVSDDVLTGENAPPDDGESLDSLYALTLASLYDHWEYAQLITTRGMVYRDSAYLSGLLRFIAERRRMADGFV